MRRLAAFVATSWILCTAAAQAQLPDAWEHWRYSRPLQLDAAAEGRLVRVTLPLAVYGKAETSLADLRLIDEAGREVPYILHARRGRQSRQWREARISELGFVAGSYTELLADTATAGTSHNSLQLETDESDFFTWVEVAAGDDRATWRVLRDRAPIYRFETDRIEGTRTVSYSETRSRWLRIRVLRTDRLFHVDRCRVARHVVEQAELERRPAEPRPDPQAPRGESLWQVDLQHAGVPASALRFRTAREEFHRPVGLAVSADGTDWEELGQGEIYRYVVAGTAEDGSDLRRTRLEVEFREGRGRYWRATVFNRNDAPIDDLEVELLGTPRHVVFRPQAGRDYRLLYGNHRADRPEYELARLTPREALESAAAMQPGPERANEGYRSPDPWTERNPAVLWIALVVAVAVLAWLAIRSLR